jgi:2-C-methyl-D-erythritol 2,4-cyclodiphosphate synthase
MVHVGIGYDVHAFAEGRRLILGGVEIPHPRGLDGHSDADVLMHAICDAILGALGEVDIGHFFPNTDPRWKGAPSRIFLQEAARQIAARGGRLVNVDATVIAQAPKIFPHLDHKRTDGLCRPRRRHRRAGRGGSGIARIRCQVRGVRCQVPRSTPDTGHFAPYT